MPNQKQPDHGPAVADEDPDYSPMDKPVTRKAGKKSEKEERPDGPGPEAVRRAIAAGVK
jgi:hypothetical protein